MAYGNCNTCGAGISWDKQKREAMNTRRPLNYDGTIHDCQGGGTIRQYNHNNRNNKDLMPSSSQGTKSLDIKAAQEQRKQEHDELIIEMRNLRKAIVAEIASRKDVEAQDVIDSIGFDQYREEQRQEGYEDL